ncbi:GH32 C-terminal domain-containing protein [Microbacterium sp. M28]|uniref:GH32 C-terminal domain-containing protein n=1 Tax=Microbacterium sp. M28 TaxID=2962064 RepID=UPI0021F3E045|nr:GH32 C-terminal domain-containing protein [Microbacterium sp. M28]UYO96545.1 GH32 C-terminal domain-containing protein [Microbacterium sp. M28]
MIFDLSFTGNPVTVVDAARGSASIVIDAPAAQRRTLGKPRRGRTTGESALYLDGWSTWVEHRGRTYEDVEVRLSAWFAPRAIASGDSRGFTALIDATDVERGVALGHVRSGRIAAIIGGELLVGERMLDRDRWHHLVLEVNGGASRLFLDGIAAGEVAFRPRTVSLPSLVRIGRTGEAPLVDDLFRRGAANGLLARASVALLQANGAGDVPTADPAAGTVGSRAETAPDRSRFADDPHRPIAHVTAPQGWMNEPHAAIEVAGTHHLFSQHNPVGPYWGDIAWAHAVSEDLAHWRDEPIALAPADTIVAPDGIWSGSSVTGADGEHLLFFTAGDMSAKPDQSVAVARPDGAGWKADEVPVLRMPASVPGRTESLVDGQFRDPFVWREGEAWFMLVGAGLEGLGGAALLFDSSDGREWRQCEPLLVGDVGRFPATGVMWELPVLLPVGIGADGRTRHALFVAPWWAGTSEHHLQHVWHWVGVWSAAERRFVPDHAEPREFDGGGHLTGPSGTLLSDGRSILWTIAQDKRSGEEFAATGWAHNAGWPLELGLHSDGGLSVRPVAELRSLREPQLAPAAGDELARGRHLDIELEITGAQFEMEVLRNADGSESTVLGVTGSEVWIDRSRSSHAPEHREGLRGIARPDSATVRARVVVDGSMIEFYVDDRVALTSRAYPVSPDAQGVRVRIGADSRLERCEIHPLHSAYAPADPE